MNTETTTKNQYILVSIILFFAFILRLYLSQFGGYELDINHFSNWSKEAYINGFYSFYQNTHSDYPPFYIYILWIIGAVNNFLSNDINSLIILKTPALIADIVTAFFIFFVARKYTTFKISLLSTILYVFNPLVIFDSAIWGQVDSIYTLLLMFAIYEFISEKPTTSAIFFALAILTKPQSVILIPLFIVMGLKKYSIKILIKSSLISFVVFLFLALPFYINTSILELFKLYTSSYIQYPFTTLNAFNFWALGGMFQPDNVMFIFLTYRLWGYLLFGAFSIYVIYFVIKNKDDRQTYIASALLFLGFFMIFTRIHERYIFPMFALLAIAMIFDKRLYYVYLISTLSFFMNLYLVFEEVKTGVAIPFSMLIIPYAIVINIVIFIYFIYCFKTHRLENI